MIELPNEKYSVIYADPPWRFGSKGARSGKFGALDYPDMPTDEIAALPVETIAEDNAALFMWITGAHMATGEHVTIMRAWGFKPIRVDAVWNKYKQDSTAKHAVCGSWGMTDAEFLLMGVRGKMCGQQLGKRNMYTVVDAEYTGKHSEKPSVFRERIERRFGDVKRIELFARERCDGWDAWGNEI